MTVEWAGEKGVAVEIRFSGLLGEDDFVDLQSKLMMFVAENGRARVLALLDGFTGWAEGEWNNPVSQRAAEANEELIDRVAIVGDPEWKEESLMFAGHPFTAKDVRFFLRGELPAARAWIAEGAEG